VLRGRIEVNELEVGVVVDGEELWSRIDSLVVSPKQAEPGVAHHLSVAVDGLRVVAADAPVLGPMGLTVSLRINEKETGSRYFGYHASAEIASCVEASLSKSQVEMIRRLAGALASKAPPAEAPPPADWEARREKCREAYVALYYALWTGATALGDREARALGEIEREAPSLDLKLWRTEVWVKAKQAGKARSWFSSFTGSSSSSPSADFAIPEEELMSLIKQAEELSVDLPVHFAMVLSSARVAVTNDKARQGGSAGPDFQGTLGQVKVSFSARDQDLAAEVEVQSLALKHGPDVDLIRMVDNHDDNDGEFHDAVESQSLFHLKVSDDQRGAKLGLVVRPLKVVAYRRALDDLVEIFSVPDVIEDTGFVHGIEALGRAAVDLGEKRLEKVSRWEFDIHVTAPEIALPIDPNQLSSTCVLVNLGVLHVKSRDLAWRSPSHLLAALPQDDLCRDGELVSLSLSHVGVLVVGAESLAGPILKPTALEAMVLRSSDQGVAVLAGIDACDVSATADQHESFWKVAASLGLDRPADPAPPQSSLPRASAVGAPALPEVRLHLLAAGASFRLDEDTDHGICASVAGLNIKGSPASVSCALGSLTLDVGPRSAASSLFCAPSGVTCSVLVKPDGARCVDLAIDGIKVDVERQAVEALLRSHPALQAPPASPAPTVTAAAPSASAAVDIKLDLKGVVVLLAHGPGLAVAELTLARLHNEVVVSESGSISVTVRLHELALADRCTAAPGQIIRATSEPIELAFSSSSSSSSVTSELCVTLPPLRLEHHDRFLDELLPFAAMSGAAKPTPSHQAPSRTPRLRFVAHNPVLVIPALDLELTLGPTVSLASSWDNDATDTERFTIKLDSVKGFRVREGPPRVVLEISRIDEIFIHHHHGRDHWHVDLRAADIVFAFERELLEALNAAGAGAEAGADVVAGATTSFGVKIDLSSVDVRLRRDARDYAHFSLPVFAASASRGDSGTTSVAVERLILADPSSGANHLIASCAVTLLGSSTEVTSVEVALPADPREAGASEVMLRCSKATLFASGALSVTGAAIDQGGVGIMSAMSLEVAEAGPEAHVYVASTDTRKVTVRVEDSSLSALLGFGAFAGELAVRSSAWFGAATGAPQGSPTLEISASSLPLSVSVALADTFGSDRLVTEVELLSVRGRISQTSPFALVCGLRARCPYFREDILTDAAAEVSLDLARSSVAVAWTPSPGGSRLRIPPELLWSLLTHQGSKPAPTHHLQAPPQTGGSSAEARVVNALQIPVEVMIHGVLSRLEPEGALPLSASQWDEVPGVLFTPSLASVSLELRLITPLGPSSWCPAVKVLSTLAPVNPAALEEVVASVEVSLGGFSLEVILLAERVAPALFELTVHAPVSVKNLLPVPLVIKHSSSTARALPGETAELFYCAGADKGRDAVMSLTPEVPHGGGFDGSLCYDIRRKEITGKANRKEYEMFLRVDEPMIRAGPGLSPRTFVISTERWIVNMTQHSFTSWTTDGRVAAIHPARAAAIGKCVSPQIVCAAEVHLGVTRSSHAALKLGPDLEPRVFTLLDGSGSRTLTLALDTYRAVASFGASTVHEISARFMVTNETGLDLLLCGERIPRGAILAELHPQQQQQLKQPLAGLVAVDGAEASLPVDLERPGRFVVPLFANQGASAIRHIVIDVRLRDLTVLVTLTLAHELPFSIENDTGFWIRCSQGKRAMLEVEPRSAPAPFALPRPTEGSLLDIQAIIGMPLGGVLFSVDLAVERFPSVAHDGGGSAIWSASRVEPSGKVAVLLTEDQGRAAEWCKARPAEPVPAPLRVTFEIKGEPFALSLYDYGPGGGGPLRQVVDLKLRGVLAEATVSESLLEFSLGVGELQVVNLLERRTFADAIDHRDKPLLELRAALCRGGGPRAPLLFRSLSLGTAERLKLHLDDHLVAVLIDYAFFVTPLLQRGSACATGHEFALAPSGPSQPLVLGDLVLPQATKLVLSYRSGGFTGWACSHRDLGKTLKKASTAKASLERVEVAITFADLLPRLRNRATSLQAATAMISEHVASELSASTRPWIDGFLRGVFKRTPDASDAPFERDDNPGITARRVEVFECQRHNMFSWKDPFMPTDPPAWSDADHNAMPAKGDHAWLPGGFMLKSQWRVQVDDNTDGDGWMYNTAFKASTGWSKSRGVRCVRRRRWVAEIAPQPK
jgi:hypothetical protein